MTMVILAVLAVMALPRFANQTTFKTRGFYDEMMSLLHYAQKAAIAQHRTVCVSFTATGATFTIASTFPFTGTNCDGGNLTLPVTQPAVGSGLVANLTQTPLQFLPSGGTNQSGNATMTITGSNGVTFNITIDAVTGYAYTP